MLTTSKFQFPCSIHYITSGLLRQEILSRFMGYGPYLNTPFCEVLRQDNRIDWRNITDELYPVHPGIPSEKQIPSFIRARIPEKEHKSHSLVASYTNLYAAPGTRL